MKIVLLGAPGAGKGTQAQKLVADYHVAHISTGDLLRAAVKAQSALGIKAKEYMDAGQLVPDDLVIGLVKERLAQDDAQIGFILDGFPRNTAQATVLDAELAQMGIELDGALLVDVASDTAGPEATVCPRCEGEMYQRDDDKPETIAKRLDTYDKQTAPLIEYYGGKGILIKVDGDRPVDDVYVDVKKELGL